MIKQRNIFILAFTISSIINGMEDCSSYAVDLMPQCTLLLSDNINDLLLKGILHIKNHGELFEARAGSGQQAYDVSYALTNPLNRVLTIRKEVATKYFCRELLAYFKNSLNVNDGLGRASSIWRTIADKDGNICSNYGYYIFHQKVAEYDNRTQYEWVIAQLSNNLDSRKAFININQPKHKFEENKDFPCTLGLQFFVRQNKLCVSVASRSTDIYTGLPYDMGFFSLVAELVYKNLQQQLPKEKAKELGLGYIVMKTNFTQIYDKTRTQALKLLDKDKEILPYTTDMPEIYDAQETLNDIYNSTSHTPIMKWIYKHADIKS